MTTNTPREEALTDIRQMVCGLWQDAVVRYKITPGSELEKNTGKILNAIDDLRAALSQHDALTELKAAVEGMKNPEYLLPRTGKLTDMEMIVAARYDGYNAALSAVADKIDEMIRRG